MVSSGGDAPDYRGGGSGPWGVLFGLLGLSVVIAVWTLAIGVPVVLAWKLLSWVAS